MRCRRALLLILGSACTAPLLKIGGLTLTGDRALGLVAAAALIGYGLGGRLRWTPVHSALAVFVGAQLATTLVNASRWLPGLRFAIVYVLGFACFALAAEWARGLQDRWVFARAWIVTGAGLGVIAALLGAWANVSEDLVWGTDIVQPLAVDPEHLIVVFAGKATFGEPNLMSSFLLVPFTLGLWCWRRGSMTPSMTGLALGLTFGFTRAAWLAAAAIASWWWWTERPPWRRVATLAVTALLALLLQAAVVGASPLAFRMLQPVARGHDRNMAGRMEIGRVVVDSWLTRPLWGHGAGSVNRLTIVRPGGKRITGIWTGNLVLFVLHDSGVLGLGALLWLAAVVWRRGVRAVRRRAALAMPLLVAGAGLAFAFQFTHGLWLMYPYVYLGLLAAATEAPAATPSQTSAPTSLGRTSRIWPRSTASAS